jgi:hypothetical protein
MAFLLPIAGALFSGLSAGALVGGALAAGAIGLGVSALSGGKKTTAAQAPMALPIASRDTARAEVQRRDSLIHRHGAASDQILNGSTGAEAAFTPGKLVLGN